MRSRDFWSQPPCRKDEGLLLFVIKVHKHLYDGIFLCESGRNRINLEHVRSLSHRIQELPESRIEILIVPEDTIRAEDWIHYNTQSLQECVPFSFEFPTRDRVLDSKTASVVEFFIGQLADQEMNEFLIVDREFFHEVISSFIHYSVNPVKLSRIFFVGLDLATLLLKRCYISHYTYLLSII